MGGLESEVDRPKTDVLLLEAANFEPVGILRTSERLGLRTEGSNRWEKGVDPHLAPTRRRRSRRQLIVELTGARWTGDADVQGELPERPSSRVPARAHRRVVGLEPPPEQHALLTRLGFDVADDWTVTVRPGARATSPARSTWSRRSRASSSTRSRSPLPLRRA